MEKDTCCECEIKRNGVNMDRKKNVWCKYGSEYDVNMSNREKISGVAVEEKTFYLSVAAVGEK